jgi:hypothetical protein
VLVELLPVWSLSLVDDGGTTSAMRGTFKAGFSTEDYLAALATLAAVVQPITGCSLVRYAVTYRLKESDPATAKTVLPITPLARFIFELDDTPPSFSEVRIPLNEDWLFTTGELAGYGIDLENTDVSSFTTEINRGIWCNPFAVDFTAVSAAYKVEAQ